MTIKYSQIPNVRVGQIEFGKVFEANGELCMVLGMGDQKVEGEVRAVTLSEGILVTFNSDTMVKPVSCRLVVD